MTLSKECMDKTVTKDAQPGFAKHAYATVHGISTLLKALRKEAIKDGVYLPGCTVIHAEMAALHSMMLRVILAHQKHHGRFTDI